MKKLFLLPLVFATTLIICTTAVLAWSQCNVACDGTTCVGDYCVSGEVTKIDDSYCGGCAYGWDCYASYICRCVHYDPGCGVGLCEWKAAYCAPEFTSIGMGLAITGAGIGYALIRRKKK